MRRFITGALSFLLALTLVPTAAFADGAEVVVTPSSDGVTNQAAKIEVLDDADRIFYIYSYSGTQQLTFPSDYKYYKDSHTITVKLTGKDATKACDDNIAFFSGNECDVSTVSQDKTGADTRTCTVKMAGHDGPAPYTVVASSGVTASFKAMALTIPDSISLNHSTLSFAPGEVGRLVPSTSGVTWVSSNPNVAAVSTAGIVTAGSDGTAIITSTYAQYGLRLIASCKVTVGGGASVASIKKGVSYVAGSSATKAKYTVTDTSKRTVTYTACKSSKSAIVVPESIGLDDGKTYAVTKIAASAFKSSRAKTVTIKASRLTKKSVKGCFKNSKVNMAKLSRYGAYKKYFTKANCGKKIKVKKA